jgi:hypothetical protein
MYVCINKIFGDRQIQFHIIGQVHECFEASSNDSIHSKYGTPQGDYYFLWQGKDKVFFNKSDHVICDTKQSAYVISSLL